VENEGENTEIDGRERRNTGWRKGYREGVTER
jgi:hypothetical protein